MPNSLCHITDSKSPAFEVYCKRLLDSVSHKKKLPGFGIRNPLYCTWGDHSLRFLFLLLLLSICSPDSIYVCTVQYHKIYLLLFRGCHLYCFCLFQRSVRARFSQRRPIPVENGNLSMPENLVMTSAYARCLSIQTLRVGVKKLGRVENEASDLCVAVPFDEKLSILRSTNGVARVKILIEVSCVRLTTKFSEINFLGFTFCLVTLLVTLQENPSLARRNKKYN